LLNVTLSHPFGTTWRVHEGPPAKLLALLSEIPQQIHETSGWLHLHPDVQPDAATGGSH